jgi:hypothetical protein
MQQSPNKSSVASHVASSKPSNPNEAGITFTRTNGRGRRLLLLLLLMGDEELERCSVDDDGSNMNSL